MALIIETMQIFFDQDDSHDMKNSLSKSMKEGGYNQIAEVKNDNGVVIGRTYQPQPKLLRDKKINFNEKKEGDNVFKFNVSGDK